MDFVVIDFVKVDYISPLNISEELVKDFKRYLIENLNGETPYNYFTKFKQLCKAATKRHVFEENPAEDITITRSSGVKKEILSFSEIEKLARTPCDNDQLRLAFLFCLNTGLRHCDVRSLKWGDIDFENNLIKKQQSKVKESSISSFVYIDLNNNTRVILSQIERAENKDMVFDIPRVESCLYQLKKWVNRAGITKNITWHSARHSFATNLLFSNTDIKTVSGLLGHSDIKHTQKYTHLVNELKKKAVNNLPDLTI